MANPAYPRANTGPAQNSVSEGVPGQASTIGTSSIQGGLIPVQPGPDGWGMWLLNRFAPSKVMGIKRSFTLLGLLALSVAPLSSAAGQVRIVGRVVDDLTEFPIPNVRITLLARDGTTLARTETDGTGTFDFSVRRRSGVKIEAARFGYVSNTTPVLYFDNRIFFQVEVRLDPDVILLAPLEVIAWSERPENAMLEGFRRRRETGLGTFITREEFEQRKPSLVTDLLREVPGLDVASTGSGTRPVVRIERAGNRDCTTQIFVDGFLVNRRAIGSDGYRPIDFRIDDAVSPASVEGIEIYKGLGTVPAEFLNPDAICGVIAIWTRRGGD